MTLDYLHGYSTAEQRRLVDQAAYWGERFLLREFAPREGGRLLEAGCGVGAVLAVLAERHPRVRYSGIDLSAAQIEAGRRYLDGLGFEDIELVVGDAARLPWPDATFDDVYAVWFIEHLPDPAPILAEIRRVIKPGGTITLNETDYTTLNVWPDSEDYRYFRESFCEMFRACGGHPTVGRRLGPLLVEAGYRNVRVNAWGYHYYRNPERADLKAFVDYCASFLSSTPPDLIRTLGRDPERLRRGLDEFRSIAERPDGSATLLVYRATGEG